MCLRRLTLRPPSKHSYAASPCNRTPPKPHMCELRARICSKAMLSERGITPMQLLALNPGFFESSYLEGIRGCPRRAGYLKSRLTGA